MKLKNHCPKCDIQPYCAVNNWCLWVRKRNCPNYKEGKKEWDKFMKELQQEKDLP